MNIYEEIKIRIGFGNPSQSYVQTQIGLSEVALAKNIEEVSNYPDSETIMRGYVSAVRNHGAGSILACDIGNVGDQMNREKKALLRKQKRIKERVSKLESLVQK